ncbi:MAG: DUF4386 domain-containing protein [Caldilineaceae bacterium]|nr:DUF4386 domain-containing protein [Caldilineaceae bacterium]
MNNLQKIGGVAALINAAAYIIGFGMVFTLLAPIMDAQPEQYLAFLADNQALLYVWHLIIYIVAGVFMVPLVLAMHERLRSHAPALSQIALAIGLIWSGLVIAAGMLFLKDIVVIAELYRQDPTQAVTIWPALTAVESALGGGIELPGGLWALLVSWAAWRTDALPKALNILGLLIGAAGILMLAPAFAEAGGAIFGLGFILWFAWAGVVMMRRGQPVAQEVYMPSRPLSQHYT